MSEVADPRPRRVASIADDADEGLLARLAVGEIVALEEVYERF
jgi:hypothetical protein